MHLTREDVALLACPVCRGTLRFDGRIYEDRLGQGVLECQDCGRPWAVQNGLAALYDERRVQGLDRMLRPVYDLIAPVHDLAVNLSLPILQFPDLDNGRHNYIARLDLPRLNRGFRGDPLRILEVGIGAGANVRLIEDQLASDLDVELWGLDLSRGMMRQCQRNLRWHPPTRRVRLLLADAHVLPFPDATFDRVFHVGAINGYRDRRAALAEMARVAKPGTPIVVVDEELDPRRSHSLYHRLAFRSITTYDPDPRSPRAELPAEAVNIEETAVSRFYYCLRFEMPAARPRV